MDDPEADAPGLQAKGFEETAGGAPMLALAKGEAGSPIGDFGFGLAPAVEPDEQRRTAQSVKKLLTGRLGLS